MLQRAKSHVHALLRALAALPLWCLSEQDRGELIEHFLNSIICKIDASGKQLRFMASTPILLSRARTVLSKEIDTIAWIDQFTPADVLWDIGANVGVYSIYAAALRNATVLAFEPSADNYMALCRNLALNGMGEIVIPYCLAFSETTKIGHLNSNNRVLGAALHQFGSRGDRSRFWPTEGCPCVQGMLGFSVDDFIEQFDPPFPTKLKLDVDGLELNILKGATNTLGDPRLQSVMAELSVDDPIERESGIALLSKAGFQVVSTGTTQTSAGAKAANHLFERIRERKA